jgi:diacylglycerol kinase (ATP)
MQHGEESPFKGKTGLRRLINALGYTRDGFAAAFRHEDAFRQEAVLAALMIPLALWLDVGAVGKVMMIASVLLALIVELLNSAIEATVDRISLDRHHLAKRAKDLGSAAVFLALVNVIVVWALVLYGA